MDSQTTTNESSESPKKPMKVLIKRSLIYFFCWGLLPYQAATLLFRIFKLKNI